MVGLGAWTISFRSFIVAAVIREVEARRMAWDFCLFVYRRMDMISARVRRKRGSVAWARRIESWVSMLLYGSVLYKCLNGK